MRSAARGRHGVDGIGGGGKQHGDGFDMQQRGYDTMGEGDDNTRRNGGIGGCLLPCWGRRSPDPLDATQR